VAVYNHLFKDKNNHVLQSFLLLKTCAIHGTIKYIYKAICVLVWCDIL